MLFVPPTFYYLHIVFVFVSEDPGHLVIGHFFQVGCDRKPYKHKETYVHIFCRALISMFITTGYLGKYFEISVLVGPKDSSAKRQRGPIYG
jgi:hypothetical protein